MAVLSCFSLAPRSPHPNSQELCAEVQSTPHLLDHSYLVSDVCPAPILQAPPHFILLLDSHLQSTEWPVVVVTGGRITDNLQMFTEQPPSSPQTSLPVFPSWQDILCVNAGDSVTSHGQYDKLRMRKIEWSSP